MMLRQTKFEAIGTAWEVQVQTIMTDAGWAQLLNQLHERIEAFDQTYSRFRSDSLVTAMAKQAGKYTVPSDGFKLIDFYQQLYRATNGRVTPLIGQTMVEAGYDASYSLRKTKLHRPPTWDTVLSYDVTSVTVNQPVLLDFGAAGKGYLVDILGELLEAAAIDSYVINAGGDIRYRTPHDQSLEVGLENPFDSTEAIGIAQLTNASLCASAGNKRKWPDMNHIIDPSSLVSPKDIVATWVVAKDTLTADGLATALFFTAPGKLRKQFLFSYALLRKDMSLEYGSDFPVKIFEAA